MVCSICCAGSKLSQVYQLLLPQKGVCLFNQFGTKNPRKNELTRIIDLAAESASFYD